MWNIIFVVYLPGPEKQYKGIQSESDTSEITILEGIKEKKTQKKLVYFF